MKKKFRIGDAIDVYGLFSKYKSIKMALNDINKLKRSAQNIIDSASWVEKFQE